MVQYPCGRESCRTWLSSCRARAAEPETWDHDANARDLEFALRGTCTALQHAVHGVEAARCRLAPGHCATAARAQPEEMVQGLVALLGVPRTHAPYLAQSAGMAIEDAAQLERALSMHDLELPCACAATRCEPLAAPTRASAGQSAPMGASSTPPAPIAVARNLSLKMLGERLLDVPWLYRGDGIDSVRS